MTAYHVYRYESVEASEKIVQLTQGMCNMKVRIAIAIIGISAGIMAGLCFAVQYRNWSATIMAFISSVFASILLYLHLAYKKGWMVDWPHARFVCYTWAGWVCFAIGVIGMTACLVNAGVKHQTLTDQGLKGENFWITSVWFFMMAKWSSMIAVFSRRYMIATSIPLSKTPPIPVEKQF
ncbi:hypothetical protein GCK32_013135 [Trichostrongylus colubriformis]|uniref:Heme transporter hrg-1 n=1 Tax=Trichostrongylus colubriformis TaxID=6319 RepID=A0AAN8FD76_TRICO